MDRSKLPELPKYVPKGLRIANTDGAFENEQQVVHVEEPYDYEMNSKEVIRRSMHADDLGTTNWDTQERKSMEELQKGCSKSEDSRAPEQHFKLADKARKLHLMYQKTHQKCKSSTCNENITRKVVLSNLSMENSATTSAQIIESDHNLQDLKATFALGSSSDEQTGSRSAELMNLDKKIFEKFPSYVSVVELVALWKQKYYRLIKISIEKLSSLKKDLPTFQGGNEKLKHAILRYEEELEDKIQSYISYFMELINKIIEFSEKKDILMDGPQVNLEAVHALCKLKALCGDLYRYIYMVKSPTPNEEVILKAKSLYMESIEGFPFDGHPFLQTIFFRVDKKSQPIACAFIYFRSLICVFSSYNSESLSLFLEKHSIKNINERETLPKDLHDLILHFQWRFLRVLQIIYCKISTEQFAAVSESTIKALVALLRLASSSEETLFLDIMISSLCLLIETSHAIQKIRDSSRDLFAGSSNIRTSSAALHEELRYIFTNGVVLSEELLLKNERASLSFYFFWKILSTLSQEAEPDSPQIAAIIIAVYWLRFNTKIFTSTYYECKNCRQNLASLAMKCIPDDVDLAYPENLLSLKLPEDFYLRGLLSFPLYFPPERIFDVSRKEEGEEIDENLSEDEEIPFVGPLINSNCDISSATEFADFATISASSNKTLVEDNLAHSAMLLTLVEKPDLSSKIEPYSPAKCSRSNEKNSAIQHSLSVQLENASQPISPFGKEFSLRILPWPRIQCRQDAMQKDIPFVRKIRLYSLCSDFPELATLQKCANLVKKPTTEASTLNNFTTSGYTAHLLKSINDRSAEAAIRDVSQKDKSLIFDSSNVDSTVSLQLAAERAEEIDAKKIRSVKNNVKRATNTRRRRKYLPVMKSLCLSHEDEKRAATSSEMVPRRLSADCSEIRSGPAHNQLVVMDGSNVALRHGGFETKKFSCVGIRLAADFYLKLNCKVLVFVPEFTLNYEEVAAAKRAASAKISISASKVPDNVVLLNEMNREGILVVTPSQDYDDSYAIKYAQQHNGCIVTNDMYRDYVEKCHDKITAKNWIKSHLISFTFVGDEFLPNPDFIWPDQPEI
ncbi:hypothetical protein IE077_002482 [Cardiosporidium cionae]|uniref:RNase NYN domain-containing protein n=1 Tax=Cardiosporidium cionae TaxID=476202 RepID=A0ABQ7JAQ4_9APIC|nr:hypothetical protein IE077_002482 [Cardiosporidium cionae]|eukprot:KAF8821083.1 hypothetical protein IE077_002482 [Cardiosporidium cionae]